MNGCYIFGFPETSTFILTLIDKLDEINAVCPDDIKLQAKIELISFFCHSNEAFRIATLSALTLGLDFDLDDNEPEEVMEAFFEQRVDEVFELYEEEHPDEEMDGELLEDELWDMCYFSTCIAYALKIYLDFDPKLTKDSDMLIATLVVESFLQ